MIEAKRDKKLSLRQILVASLISQVIVAVGLTSYFSWRNSRKTVEDLALRLSREVTAHTKEHVREYLNIPATFLEINRIFVDLENLNTESLAELKDVFWHQTQINPEINTIFFGSQTGDFVEIEKAESSKLMIRDRTTAPYWEIYSLDTQGNIVNKLKTQQYDPRERPWYRAAVEYGDLVWSPIYLFADPPVLGITPAIPLQDPQSDRLAGVLAIDLTLNDISQFLNSLKISESGRAFIIEKSGKMVATSTNNPLIKTSTGEQERLHYSESSDPAIEAAADFLSNELNGSSDIHSDKQLIFNFKGDRHFIQVANLEGYPGLDWLIVTVIPESDFLAYIRRNTYTTLLLSTLALISAILLGAIANQLIINSVTSISAAAKAMSRGQALNIEEQPPIKEFAAISESIDSMASQLQDSALTLENLESFWSRQAEENTRNLRQANQQLTYLVNIDGLTQIYNRYYFNLVFQRLWQETLIERGIISLIMCDVDNFKQYNDTYGHLMGDECLTRVAQTIANSVNRNRDIVARYGGEEFVVILPRTNAEGAMQIAVRINEAIRELNIPHDSSTVLNRVTISCGVASIVPNPSVAAVSLIENADRALYRAKERGRNCSVLAE